MNVMRRFSVFLGVVLSIGLASAAGASDCVQLDMVDIGDPASEAGHSLVGWGPIEPAHTGGNYGGIDDCRVVYASEANGDGNDWATVDLDFGENMLKMKCLAIDHLEGIAVDAFDVYIYPPGHPEDAELVFSFLGDQLTVETWHTSSVSFAATGMRTVKFVSTGPLWSGWPTYGQIAIDAVTAKECDPLKDLVDIGNPGSEAGHNLVSWGPIEPANTGGHYGGVEDCRVIWAPAAPEEPWATIDLDFGECYGPKCLTLQHLEGAAEDAFDVLLYPPGEPENARLLFSYPGSPGTSEVWHKTAIRVLTSGIMTVKLVAQGEAWSGFGTYGQVAFDAIRVDDWVPVCSFVDIGVPESESGHNLQGWGPIEPETSGGNYGGIANCRAVYASEANGDGNDWATVDLDLGGCACPLSLKLHHLDGLAKDAFNVFLYPAGHPEASELIFSWAGDELTEEIWYMSSVTIEGTGIHTIKFVSTEPPWAHFDVYGQVCIDTIMVVPCQTFPPPASIPTAAFHPRSALHLQPNPFRTSTALQLRLNDATPVTFLIYDIQGRQVCRVADQLFQPGQHQLIWDGKDASGHPVAPGIYLYQVRMDGRADMNGKVIHVR